MRVVSKSLLVVFGCLLAFVLTACGSSDTRDFSLSFTPASINIVHGQSAVVTLTANRVANSSGTVAIVLTDLPDGVHADPFLTTQSIGTSQKITFRAENDAKAGKGSITATGTSGLNTHTASLPITVQ